MAKIGSYRWEGKVRVLRSLEKADKQEITDALEEVASGNCDEGPIEGSSPTPDRTGHAWPFVTILLQSAA
jgi:hypothetical protein